MIRLHVYLILTLLFLACIAPADAASVLATNSDGSFTATTANYTAKVGTDGNLHSLKSGGTEFLLDGYRGVVGGGYLTFTTGPEWSATVFRFTRVEQTAPDQLTAKADKHQLTYRFLPDAIELGFTHTAEPYFWFFVMNPAINDIMERDSGDTLTIQSVGFEREGQPQFFAPNGANLTLPRASLRANLAQKNPGTDPLFHFIWMEATPIGRTWTKRMVIHAKPTASDALQANLTIPRANHILPGNAPAEVGLAGKLRFPGLTVDGEVELVLKEFKEKEVAFQKSQPFKVAAMGETKASFSTTLPAGFYDGVLTVKQGNETLVTRTFPLAYDIKHMMTPERPADFDKFWDDTLAEQEKIPVNLQMTRDNETPDYKFYKVRFDGLLGYRFHAWLSVPKAEGKFPGSLTLPPSGINVAYMPPCGNVVGMSLAIAGQEVGVPLESMKSWDYWRSGIEKRETWYYRVVFAACSRAVNIIAARPETDTTRIEVHGGSQGGGLAFITAALNPKVTMAESSSPGLFGLEWKLRYPNSFSWPPIHFDTPPTPQELEERIAVVRYGDAANFAPRIKCAVLLNVGLHDVVTVPVGVLAAWQRLGNARTRALLADPWGGHNGPRGAGTLSAQWYGKLAIGQLDDVAQFTSADSLPVLVETKMNMPADESEVSSQPAPPSFPTLSSFITQWQVSRLMPKGAGLSSAPAVTRKKIQGWPFIKADYTGFVNIHPLFAENADGIVYLATEITLKRGSRWTLLVGHDGGVRVFVDGKPVLTQAERTNPARPDRSKTEVMLTKGKHTLVVALDTDQGLGWGIFVRFAQRFGDRKPGVKPEFPECSLNESASAKTLNP